MGIEDYEARELFAEETGLTAYETQMGVSRDVARRHQTIRKLIAEAGGIVPAISELRMSLLVKGFKCSLQTVRSDLRDMGWK